MNQYKYIDCLRGIAILGVILVHTSQYGTSIYTDGISLYPGFINRIFEQGARGVQLFYVVSAFTLFLSFHKRSGSYSKFNSSYFFIRRIFRVVPLYWMAILYFGIIAPQFIFHSPRELMSFNVFTNLTLLNSLHPGGIIVPGGWTISVEMLFYLMLPILFRFITNLNRAVLFTIGAVMVAVIYSFNFFRIFPHTQELEYFYFTSIPNQLALFGFGIIAYFIKIRRDMVVHPYLILVLSLFIILQCTLVRFIPNHIIFGIAFMILVLIGNKLRLLNSTFIAYLGKISYSAYFVHFAVLSLMAKMNFIDFVSTATQSLALLNFGIRFTIVVIIVIAMSSFTYYTIEIPTQKFGKMLIRSRIAKLRVA